MAKAGPLWFQEHTNTVTVTIVLETYMHPGENNRIFCCFLALEGHKSKTIGEFSHVKNPATFVRLVISDQL